MLSAEPPNTAMLLDIILLTVSSLEVIHKTIRAADARGEATSIFLDDSPETRYLLSACTYMAESHRLHCLQEDWKIVVGWFRMTAF